MSIKKQLLLDFLKKNILTPEVFIKTMLPIALLFSYAYIFSCVLTPGVNYFFVTALCSRLLALAAILFLMFSIYSYCTEQKDFKYVHSVEKFYTEDLFLLFLPMTPIVRYIILNQGDFSVGNNIIVFSFFLGLSFILVFLVPGMVSRVGPRKILMITGLSFSCMLFNMASLAADFKWHIAGDFKIQLIIFTVLLTISLVVYSWNRKLLNIMAATVFAVSLFVSLAHVGAEENQINEASDTVSRSEIDIYIKGRKMKRKPNIFLLTYDGYVENETMLQHGIDNSGQEDYLIQNGFHIYRGAYSLAPFTVPSMGLVLSIDSDTNLSVDAASGNGIVQNILKENGYKTIGHFPWNNYFRGVRVLPSYDQWFPPELGANRFFIELVLEGEFRFNGGGEYEKFYDEYLQKKKEVLASTADKPRFLFTHHMDPGHAQFSGKCRVNEAELFEERLMEANRGMRRDIEIVKNNNPDAIIIINGDHGPYLTKNCYSTSSHNAYDKSEIDRLDIQDRFGSFLAIKWPEDANIDHDKIEILQDIFPSVFSYLYDDPSIADKRADQLTSHPGVISGVRVRRGMIEGGKDDGKLLFDSMTKR